MEAPSTSRRLAAADICIACRRRMQGCRRRRQGIARGRAGAPRGVEWQRQRRPSDGDGVQVWERRRQTRSRGGSAAGATAGVEAVNHDSQENHHETLNAAVREADARLREAAARRIRVPSIDISSFSDARHAGGNGELERARAHCIGEVRHACASVGMFEVRGHGMPRHVLRRAFTSARRFFERASAEEKERAAATDSSHGYVGSASMSRVYGRGHERDERECFCIGPEDREFQGMGNTFPSTSGSQWCAGDLRRHSIEVHETFGCLEACLCRILTRALAEEKGVDLDDCWMSEEAVGRNGSLCCFNFYSSHPSSPSSSLADSGGLRQEFPAHTDWGALTILAIQRGSDGLELIVDGDWRTLSTTPASDYGRDPGPSHDNASDEFMVVVNVADFLSRWSNGAFASPIHRVKRLPEDRGRGARLSIAYFVGGVVHEVDGRKRVRPIVNSDERALFDPISLGEYLKRNYDRTLKDQ